MKDDLSNDLDIKTLLDRRPLWETVVGLNINKARYTATEVACGWAGVIFEVTGPFGQEQ